VNLKLLWMRSKSERMMASRRRRLATGPSTLMVTVRSAAIGFHQGAVALEM
jgi:DNA anti-recombination protein RmuC